MDPADPGTADDGLVDAVEEAFERIERGEVPDLDRLCGGDPDLRRKLLRILARGPIGPEDFTAESGAGIPLRFEAGARLGDFRILELIGQGAMGRVFLAVQESLGREVALKVIDSRSDDRATRLRFQREAEIAAALDHPHIVPVHAVGEAHGVFYIAMKRLSGPSLDRLRAPLPPEEAARIGSAVSRALDEAHRAGVLHRDLKPGNVILDHGRPYLVDFGLARAQASATLTREGTAPGTIPYMAPELFSGAAPVFDRRTEVYGLGAMLYEIVAGAPAFSAGDPGRLIHRILSGPPPSLRLAGRLRDLETIILRCLDQDPARRFQTAGDVADDLDRFLRDEPVRSRRIGVLVRAARLVRRHRRAAWLLAASGAFGLAAAAALGFRILREDARVAESVRAGRARLEAGDLAGARALAAAHPDDERVRGLKAQVDAAERLEDLLDQVMDRREAQNPETLRNLLRRARSAASLDTWPRLAAMGLMARVLAHLHLGEREEASVLLSNATPSRGLLALRRVLDGPAGSVPGALPEGTADDHVVAALALRLIDRPPGEVHGELRRALEIDAAHFRARFLEAVLLSAGHEYASARRLLDGLRVARPGHRGVLRQVLRLALLTGDRGTAREALDTLGLPQSPAEAMQRLWYLRLEGSGEDFAEELRIALSGRWRDEPEILWMSAQAAIDAGAWDAAEPVLIRLRSQDHLTEYAASARVHLLYVELGRIQSALAGGAGVEALHPRLEALAAAASKEASDPATARLPAVRARALVAEAKALGQLGRRIAYEALMREATLADPARWDAAFELMGVHLVETVDVEAAGSAERSDLEIWTRLTEARNLARAVLAFEDRGLLAPPAAVIERALAGFALWSDRLGESAVAAGAARRALELMGARAAGDPLDARIRRLLRIIVE